MKGKKVTVWKDLELEDRDIVVTRSGICYIVSGEFLLGLGGFMDKSSYNKDLKAYGGEQYDIVKVYNAGRGFGYGLKQLLDKDFLKENKELVWEREE